MKTAMITLLAISTTVIAISLSYFAYRQYREDVERQKAQIELEQAASELKRELIKLFE